ncbi:uncharacterized protein PAC_05987 [Phialocephala subalpina]|uniref:Uncharacterized protein n=1 Tax=Phialocephala subalpina TaxID=576137 RepID=A0A1L7WTM0_9HELO|nr:uncharacterized protein PAC_05987 [Phialocephala subalpina]
MSYTSVPKDAVSKRSHEVFEPLNETASTEDFSAIKDPRQSSILETFDIQNGETFQREQPKPVACQSRKYAFLRSLIHLPAIFMTLATLSLSFRGLFWQAPTSYTNTVLNVLQFVAKVHESLILFSLTAIVFHRIRYEMMTREGIPFGLLSSGLQYSNLMFFARSDFRHTLSSSRRFLGLVGIIILAFLLASTCGPSAAIMVLPRLEWWPVKSSPRSNTAPPVIYLNATGLTFPAVMTAAEDSCTGDENGGSCAYLNYCTGTNATGQSWCPSGGLDAILNSGMVQSLMAGDLVLSPSQILVSSFDQSIGGVSTFSRSLNGNLLREGNGKANSSVFVASVVPDVTAMALGTFWEEPSHGFAKTDSPGAMYHNVSPSYNNTVTCTIDAKWIPSQAWIDPTTDDVVHESTTDPLKERSHFKNNQGKVTLSRDWLDVLNPNVSPSYNNTVTCTIDAKWIPSQAWIDPTTDDVVHESTTDPLKERSHFKNNQGKVTLSRDWLDVLNVNIVDETVGINNETTFQAIADNCIYGGNPYANYTLLNICLESTMALFIADGLARMQSTTSQIWLWQDDVTTYSQGSIHYQHNESYATPTEVSALLKGEQNEFPRFTINILQYGYGYGLQGSTIIYIAAAILLVYVIFALVHVAIVITGGWSSDTWTNPGELIALAVNSSPNKLLQNTCAGIEDPKVWTRIVSVQETTEAHLEIVFDEKVGRERGNEAWEPPQDIELQEGQSYGMALEDRLRRRVVPGKMYGTLG